MTTQAYKPQPGPPRCSGQADCGLRRGLPLPEKWERAFSAWPGYWIFFQVVMICAL